MAYATRSRLRRRLHRLATDRRFKVLYRRDRFEIIAGLAMSLVALWFGCALLFDRSPQTAYWLLAIATIAAVTVKEHVSAYRRLRELRLSISLAPALVGADLSWVNLEATYLRGKDLSSAKFSHADLRKADLAHASLSDARLVHADLRGASIHDATATSASFFGAQLEGADARNLHASDTSFQHADLRGINLQGATLQRCRFDGAHIEGVDFSEVRCITNADLSAAFADTSTTWPDGTTGLKGPSPMVALPVQSKHERPTSALTIGFAALAFACTGLAYQVVIAGGEQPVATVTSSEVLAEVIHAGTIEVSVTSGEATALYRTASTEPWQRLTLSSEAEVVEVAAADGSSIEVIVSPSDANALVGCQIDLGGRATRSATTPGQPARCDLRAH